MGTQPLTPQQTCDPWTGVTPEPSDDELKEATTEEKEPSAEGIVENASMSDPGRGVLARGGAATGWPSGASGRQDQVSGSRLVEPRGSTPRAQLSCPPSLTSGDSFSDSSTSFVEPFHQRRNQDHLPGQPAADHLDPSC